jgi:catechol 2,3-dioxygenase-like lactoylglutathione lyase family enzyme
VVGQAGDSPIPAATFTGVDHFRLHVRNVADSVAWYREVLGFDDAWYLGEKAMLRHPNSDLELVLQPRHASTAIPSDSSFDHLAFRVRDRDELEAWQSRLQALGIDLNVTPAVGGVSINLEDPDGHDLELFVRDPQARRELASRATSQEAKAELKRLANK